MTGTTNFVAAIAILVFTSTNSRRLNVVRRGWAPGKNRLRRSAAGAFRIASVNVVNDLVELRFINSAVLLVAGSIGRPACGSC